jgi:hypothetical protein
MPRLLHKTTSLSKSIAFSVECGRHKLAVLHKSLTYICTLRTWHKRGASAPAPACTWHKRGASAPAPACHSVTPRHAAAGWYGETRRRVIASILCADDGSARRPPISISAYPGSAGTSPSSACLPVPRSPQVLLHSRRFVRSDGGHGGDDPSYLPVVPFVQSCRWPCRSADPEAAAAHTRSMVYLYLYMIRRQQDRHMIHQASGRHPHHNVTDSTTFLY